MSARLKSLVLVALVLYVVLVTANEGTGALRNEASWMTEGVARVGMDVGDIYASMMKQLPADGRYVRCMQRNSLELPERW